MGGGDSYRPDRDGPSLPPRDSGRMGGPLRDRDPRPTFAEPMSSYAVCPPLPMMIVADVITVEGTA